jgi:hypothetical protein
LDVSEIAELLNIDVMAKKAVQEANANLAMMAHSKLLEIAQSKLHSRRQMFVENLSYTKVDDDTWLIVLDAKARWIDDGTDEHNMLDALLKSPKAKRAKDGSTYLVVPFNHGPGKGKGSSSPAQQDLISTIKSEMKSRGIPFAGIEKDSAGNAKQGRLHSFDITKSPLKSKEGPGQGWGPLGDVKQGPNERQKVGGGPGGGGTPFLSGVNVYQNPVKGKDGVEKMKKSIMTFRVASSKHRDQGGRWDHPGNEPIRAFEDVGEWVASTWENEVKPQLLETILSQMA